MVAAGTHETLPPRGDFCILGAYVVSVDPAIGEIHSGHVHFRDGEITEVDDAGSCDAPAERLEGSGRIVAPGFVDTHWHLWNVLLRGLVDPVRGVGYFAAKDQVASHYLPVDTFRATRLALAEAARAGITTVHNWHHNLRSPEDCDAALSAHRTVGLRARFSYGHPHEQPRDTPIDLDDVARVKEQLADGSDELVTLGMVVRPPNAVDDPNIYQTEWDFARKHDLPMTFHCGGKREDTSRYADLLAMADEGLLGPDVLVVHAVHANESEIRRLAETGTAISICPVTQVRSMGAPPLTELLHAGVTTGLSIDNLANPTPGDMFLQMRGSYSIERYRRPDTDLDTRRMLQLATLEGARALDLDRLTGSITPGKRADLLVIDTNSVNMVPCSDPVSQLVLCATPTNIEYVFADGRAVVHRGEFTGLHEEQLIEEARESHAALMERSNWNKAQPVWYAAR